MLGQMSMTSVIWDLFIMSTFHKCTLGSFVVLGQDSQAK
jgi:hypothetical protein